MITYGHTHPAGGVTVYETWQMSLPDMYQSHWYVGQHGLEINGKIEPFDYKDVTVKFTVKDRLYEATWPVYVNGNPNKRKISCYRKGYKITPVHDLSKLPMLEKMQEYFETSECQDLLLQQTIETDMAEIVKLETTITMIRRSIQINSNRLSHIPTAKR